MGAIIARRLYPIMRQLDRSLARWAYRKYKKLRGHLRRDVPQRSQGRGLGWHRFPHSQLYAMGLPYSGSGQLEDGAKPVHDGR